MKIRFWGVRGSIPSPGAHTVRYGGNTMCLSIGLDDDHTLILDAGSGLYHLGLEAPCEKHVYYILLSHVHWDHINGFPMFRPHMNPDASIRLFTEMNPEWADDFFGQLDGVHFPIKYEETRADLSTEDDVNSALNPFGLQVTWTRLNHRGVCFGYRLTTDEGTVIYLTDHEIDAIGTVNLSFEETVSFCAGANVLIHDAQYVAAEMSDKAGWGHSSVERACEVAHAAGVGRLVLCHHAPKRSDDDLDAIVEQANARLESEGASVRCEAAYEGMELHL